MKRFLPLALLSMSLAVAPCVTQAQPQPATTAKSVHLRAGPGRDYPVVVVLPPGYPITVEGCLPEYTWCDVIAGPSRGWVYAGNINYYYQGAYVPLPNYGALIGIAVLGFMLDDYWGHYYHDRPWYPERHRWIGRPIAPQPRFAPQPPRHVAPLPRPGVIGPNPRPHPQPHGVAPRPGPQLPGALPGVQAVPPRPAHDRGPRSERRESKAEHERR